MTDQNRALDAAAQVLNDMSGWPLTDCRFAARKMLDAAVPLIDTRQLLTHSLNVLSRHNIPSDIQDLLVQGDTTRGIFPGALHEAIAALMPKNT